jgi:RNA polymerase sigma-70 factor (ECF subfamily)
MRYAPGRHLDVNVGNGVSTAPRDGTEVGQIASPFLNATTIRRTESTAWGHYGSVTGRFKQGSSFVPARESGAKVYAPAFFRDELEFVEALRAGRHDAQAELFRRHHARIGAVLHRILGEDHDLPDLVQEVFVRAIAGARGFRGPSETLEPWLVKIAVFTARGLIRRRRVWRRFFSTSPAASDIADMATATVATAEQVEAVRRTYGLLDKLSTNERIALTLQLVDEMSLPQIAEACAVSQSTIKRRLRKAHLRFDALVAADPALRDRLQGGKRT